MSVRQFDRVLEVITGKNGQGLKVSDLRIQIKTCRTVYRSPNTAEVKIYNLNSTNEGLIKGEFDEVLVNAGYVGAARLLFRGNIRHAMGYRERTDRIVQIDAADGDRDFKNGIVNFALAAGTGSTDVVDHIVGTVFTSTKKGYVSLKDKKRLRGRVFSGMARDVLDDLAAEHDSHWSIQNGQLHIVPVTSTLPNEAIVINSDTGMLGAPEISDKGIKVRCLLNPDLVPNGKVWLNNDDIKERIRKERERKPGAKKTKKTGPSRALAKLDPDGIYKVFKIEDEGDNRSPKWESVVWCVALEAKIPSGKVAA